MAAVESGIHRALQPDPNLKLFPTGTLASRATIVVTRVTPRACAGKSDKAKENAGEQGAQDQQALLFVATDTDDMQRTEGAAEQSRPEYAGEPGPHSAPAPTAH